MQSYIGTLTYVLVSFIFIVYCEPIANFVKPNPLPKHFAIDIDGTFFVEDKDKMKENIEAFKKLKNKNINPFFCTGRHLVCAKGLLGNNFFTETDYNGFPGVYSNGSLVYDPDGELIYINKFSDNFLDKFKQFVDSNNLENKIVYTTQDGIFSVGELYEEGKARLNRIKIPLPQIITNNELKQKNIVAISFASNNFNISGLTEGVDYMDNDPNPGTKFLTSGNWTKKDGLEKLLSHLNSNGSECAFIGDGNNDKGALEYCDTSFAVGNASDDVKSKAKWVLDLNYDKGAFKKAVDLLCD